MNVNHIDFTEFIGGRHSESRPSPLDFWILDVQEHRNRRYHCGLERRCRAQHGKMRSECTQKMNEMNFD
jgi:hypothetical protein